MSRDEATLEDANLRGLIILLGHAWKVLLIAVAVGIVTAIIMLTIMTPRYEGTMSITGATLQDSAPQSLAATLLGQAQSDKFDEFRALMVSYPAAERVLSDPQLAEALLPTRRSTLEQLKAFLLGYRMPAPGPAEIQQMLVGSVQVGQSGNTGIYTVTFYHSDAVVAGKLLNTLFTTADRLLRETQLRENERAVVYYKDILVKTTEQEVRASLYQELVHRQRAIVTLKSGAPVGAAIVDPVHVSPVPTKPNVFGILVAIPFAALILGIFGVLAFHWWRGLV